MEMEFFKYCTLDNPVFVNALIWVCVFAFTGFWFVYFKLQEAADAKATEHAQKETVVAPAKSDKKSKKEKAKVVKKVESPTAEDFAVRRQAKKDLILQMTEKSTIKEVNEEKAVSPAAAEPAKKKKKTKKKAEKVVVEAPVHRGPVELSQNDIDAGWEMAE